jgi:predicted deacylase
MSNVQIRNIKVAPGEKVFRYIRVAETPTYTVKLPCGIINGLNPGLTISIIAGLHPTEYTGMEAATRLFQQLSPNTVSGVLLIVPVVNIPGFQVAADHVNPLDGLNLNRIFPGDPEGSISQRMIRVLFDEIMRLADVHVDLHCGEAIEAVPQYAIIPNTGTEVDQQSAILARIYAPHINKISGQPGTSAQEASTRLKIPAITAEAGGLGNYDESDISFHMTGLYPFVAEGAQVKEGQALAQIKNIQGDVLETMHSPVQGLVGMFRPKRVKNSGELAYVIWTST